MDVGQVKFSVIADGLDTTLQKAERLEGIMNGMDGKTYRAVRGAAKATEKSAQNSAKATKEENDDLQKANLQIKRRNLALKERFKTSKRIAKLEKEAERERQKRIDADRKALNDDLKNAQKLYNEQQKAQEAQDKAERKRTITHGKRLAKQWKEEQAAEKAAANAPIEYQQNWENRLARFGARMQTLGAAIQNVTQPFANVYRGLAMGVGYKLLGTVQNSIEGAVSRFDTRKLYRKMMKEYSNSNYSTAKSWNELDKSVRGLPTSVAEIAEMAQRYTLSLGDMKRGTRLAIASNRAFLASMATDTQKYQGMLQLQDLMNGKELQPREWMSLGSSMGKAINEIAKVMGAKNQDEIRKFRQELYAGKVNTDDFLKALEKVGNKGGTIYKMAEEYKNTIEALRKNVNNAFQRMGEHMLIALDDMFKSATGKGLVKNLQGITKAIDDISESAQEWIKSHPDEIMNFFNGLKEIDWKGILSGFAQFGLIMGRFYSGLAKVVTNTFGGKGLVYGMLFGNLAGKAIQIGGAFTKGLAGPISKLFTLFKFGAGGRAIKNAKELAKNHGAIVGATKTMSGMVLTWQGVASKAVSVAAIPAMAWSIKELSIGLQEFTKVDFSKLSVGKVAAAAGIITAFGGLAAGLGALTASNAFGWITTAGTAIGIAEVASISKTMKWLGEGLSSIADAKLPTVGKLRRAMNTMNEVGKYFDAKNPFEKIGKIVDSWLKSSEFKAIGAMAEGLNSIEKMLNVKVKTGWQDRAITRITHMMDVAQAIEGLMVKQDKKIEKGSTRQQEFGKGTRAQSAQKTYTYRKERLREFADYARVLSEGLGDIVGSLQSIKDFNTQWKKIANNKGEIDWESVGDKLGQLIGAFYKLSIGDGEGGSPLQKLKTAADQLKGGDFVHMTESLNQLPKIIGALGRIQKKIAESGSLFEEGGLHIQAVGHESPLSSIATKIKPMFDAIAEVSQNVPKVGGLNRLGKIKTALDKVPQIVSQLKAMSTSADVGGINVSAIHDAVAKIEEALTELDSLNEKQVNLKIDINGDITNNAKDDLDKAYKETKAALDKFDKLDKEKTVKVNLKPSISGKEAVIAAVEAAVNSIKIALAGLNTAFSKPVNVNLSGGSGGSNPNGGTWKPHQMGGAVYRANGGIIPRGTDSVSALLTPGEYVLKRRAASMLGHTLLNRLNHLDIRGALSELSARASQRSSVVSTTNNTKNISLTMNNNGSANIGLNRTSGWLNRL